MPNVNGCVRKVVLSMLAIILLTACSSADSTPTPTKTREILSSTPTLTLQPTDLPTVIPPTVSPPTVSPPTASPVSNPMVAINSDMNVRGGPGTNYPIMGTASLGQQYPITGKNSAGDWWKINYNGQAGWVFGQLVTAIDAQHVRIAAIIPALTSTPRPTSTRRPARTATPRSAGCNLQLNIPDPPSPDTDCLVWEKLYALTALSVNQDITGSALVSLESNIYPVFVTAFLNCREPLAIFSAYLHYLIIETREAHGYDPFLYMGYILEVASSAEFFDLVSSFGCDEALIIVAKLYTE